MNKCTSAQREVAHITLDACTHCLAKISC